MQEYCIQIFIMISTICTSGLAIWLLAENRWFLAGAAIAATLINAIMFTIKIIKK